MPMGYLSDEVADAAQKLGVPASRLPRPVADQLRQRIAARYGLDPRSPLWGRRYEGAEVVHDPMAWSRVAEFVGESAVVYLLFAPFVDPDVWMVPGGNA